MREPASLKRVRCARRFCDLRWDCCTFRLVIFYRRQTGVIHFSFLTLETCRFGLVRKQVHTQSNAGRSDCGGRVGGDNLE